MTIKKFGIAGAVAALMLSTAPAAFAQSATVAGTDVTNSISLSYRSAGDTVTNDSAASVTFTVDRKVDYLVERTGAGVVEVDLGEGNGEGAMAFRLNNHSNDAIDYVLSVGAPDGIDFSVEIGGEAHSLGDVFSVPQEDDVEIRIIANFPPGTGNEGYTFSITAAVHDLEPSDDAHILDMASLSTVFLFDDEDTTDDGRFDVIEPSVSASKDVIVISQDPDFACADLDAVGPGDAQAAIPGACIEYTITVRNNGRAAARNVQVNDSLPAAISLAAAHSDSFDVSTSGNVVRAALTPMTPGAEASIRIRATID